MSSLLHHGPDGAENSLPYVDVVHGPIRTSQGNRRLPQQPGNVPERPPALFHETIVRVLPSPPDSPKGV